MTGAREARSRETGLKVFRGLRLRSSGCGLVQNWGCLADFGDTKEDDRYIGIWFQTAICVVDVDVGLSQARCHPRDLAGSMRKFDLNNIGLGDGQALAF